MTSKAPFPHSRSLFSLLPARKAPLDQMMRQCSDVQKSLTSIWHSACDNASGSLQELENSKKSLRLMVRNPWLASGKYAQSRDLLEVRPKRQLHVENLSEEDDLLQEIRQFLSPQPAASTQVSPPQTPRTTRHLYTTPSPEVKDLNNFIRKARLKYKTKASAMVERRRIQQEEVMQRIAPSAEVLMKARQIILQKERRIKDLQLKRLLRRRVEEEQENRRMYLDMQSDARDLRTKATIERIYRSSRARKEFMT